VLLDGDALLGGALLAEMALAFLTLDQVGQMDGGGLLLAILTEHRGGPRLITGVHSILDSAFSIVKIAVGG
jgi:hypothetical protein